MLVTNGLKNGGTKLQVTAVVQTAEAVVTKAATAAKKDRQAK